MPNPITPYTLRPSGAPAPPPHPLLQRDRLLLAAALVLSSALSVGLLALRMAYSGHFTFRFLNWNLILAWLPLGFALAAWLLQGHTDRPRLRVLPLLALWLLFLPNAPYIATDLIHLTHREPVPLWFDLFLILSYAWNGLILGFVSLRLVQELLQRWFGAAVGWAGAVAAIGLASFGIYLGRFERWNSWDVLTNPLGILNALLNGLANPQEHKVAIVITVLLGGLLLAIYGALSLLARADPLVARREQSRL